MAKRHSVNTSLGHDVEAGIRAVDIGSAVVKQGSCYELEDLEEYAKRYSSQGMPIGGDPRLYHFNSCNRCGGFFQAFLEVRRRKPG